MDTYKGTVAACREGSTARKWKSAHVHVRKSLYVSTHMSLYVSLCMPLYVSIYMSLHVDIHVLICVLICMCAHMYLLDGLFLCVFVRERKLPPQLVHLQIHVWPLVRTHIDT